MVYFGKLDIPPTSCPHCQAHRDRLVRNGSRPVRVTLPSLSGFAAYLILRKQRYLCLRCGHTYSCQSDCVTPHSNLSQPLKRQVMDSATQLQSETLIAKNAHISVSSVRRIVSDVASTIRHRPTQSLPEHLCFDEFKSVRSVTAAMSFIVCDAQSHQVVDIVEKTALRRAKSLLSKLRFNSAPTGEDHYH